MLAAWKLSVAANTIMTRLKVRIASMPPGLAIVDVLRQLVGAPADGCEGVGIDLRSTASSITVHLRYAADMRGRHGRDDAPESQPMSYASSHAPFRTHLSRLPWQRLDLTVP